MVRNTSLLPALVASSKLLKVPFVAPVIYTDPSLPVATELALSLTVVPNNFVQSVVPSDEYLVRNASYLPAFCSEPKSASNDWPVIYTCLFYTSDAADE